MWKLCQISHDHLCSLNGVQVAFCSLDPKRMERRQGAAKVMVGETEKPTPHTLFDRSFNGDST